MFDRTFRGLIVFVVAVIVGLIFVPCSIEALDLSEGSKVSKEETRLDEIVISATRLTTVASEIEDIPSHITVFTAEDMEKNGSVTLQDLFRRESGFLLFDEVGNGVETTMDMRGFNKGDATAVFINGIHFNEPDSNVSNYSLIPIDDLMRAEVIRGGASAVYGEDALAGAINLFSQDGFSSPGTEIEGGVGSYQFRKLHVKTGGVEKGFDYYIGGTRELSDGYRDNGEYRISKVISNLGYTFSDNEHLGLLLLHSDGDFRAPGELSEAELSSNRRQSVKSTDGRDFLFTLGSLTYERPVTDNVSLTANGFLKKNNVDFFSTFRFFDPDMNSVTENTSSGTTWQLTQEREIMGRDNVLTGGLEFTRNELDSQTYNQIKRVKGAKTSDRSTNKDVLGIFLQDSMTLSEKWNLSAGVRYDEIEFDFHNLTDSTANRVRSFSQVSPKGGIVYKWRRDTSLFANTARSFQTPTIFDLFAIPGFFSNPDLEPTVADNYEVGLRQTFRDRYSATISLYRINLKDEVIFVLTDPVNFIGQNQNAASSRREGVELSITGRPTDKTEISLNYTYIDATFESGVNAGRRLTLVPDNSLGAGFTYNFLPAWKVVLSGYFVDKQFLTSDNSNADIPLDSYTVIDTRLSYTKGNFTAYFAVNNIFDEKYSTRGVTSGAQRFYNPAPEVNFSSGVSIKF